MKTYLKTIIAAASFLILFGCSKDDETSITPSASDITVVIDENPTTGTVIGTVATNLTGNLSYSISSQSVINSFNINSTTGEVVINDVSNFDFETNTIITASVTVTNSSQTAISTIEVTLNDIDDIASFLTDSKAAYNTAIAGEWIIITEAEYNLLASSLNNITKAGTTDEQYNADFDIVPSITNITITNDNTSSMPSGSFCFAFKYNAPNDNATDTKIKQSSTSASMGYSNLGNGLPIHGQGEMYFVLKGSDTPTTSEGYLAIYANSGVSGKFDGLGSYFVEPGDVMDFTSTSFNGVTVLFQGLSTTQKQWD